MTHHETSRYAEKELMVVKSLIEHPVADWIYKQANEKLSGRALSCTVNARNHLVRAQKIADAKISNTIAYFCATHATEEAVAAFITSAKKHGYHRLAGKVNIHDHAQKAVVSAYAQIISGYMQELKLAVAYNPATNDVLARVRSIDEEPVYPLRLRLFSFNENGEDPSPEDAFDALKNWFPTPEAMIKRIHERASFRDKALYASKGGTPALSHQQLDDALREHTLLTMGLIWAAMDITSHKEPEPFVVQTLGAIEIVINQVRPSKVCRHCGK